MSAADEVDRRLVWHGVLLFFLGLLAGGAGPLYENPRMGLSAHVGGVTAGTFLAVVGLFWNRIRLTAGASVAAFWLTLYGSYVSVLGLVLAAIFGTSNSTPLAGAGFSGTLWEETIVDVALITAAAAILVACPLLLWGLRASRA